MALHRYQKQYEGSAITNPVSGLLYLRAPFTGTLKSIYVWQSQDSGLQDNIYNLSKNGVNQFAGAERIIIATDEDWGEKTELEIAVTLGDVLQLNLDSVSQNRIFAPLVLEIEIDDGLSGGGGAEELDALDDVVITSPAEGDIFIFDGTHWVNGELPPSGADELDELTDVILTTPTAGDILVFDGSDWVNEAPASGGATGWHPDEPPTTPDSMDDEFPGTSLDAKWGIWNTTGTQSVSVANSALRMDATYSGATSYTGIRQTLPTAPYKFRFKMVYNGKSSSSGDGGVWAGFLESATGKTAYIGLRLVTAPPVRVQAGNAPNLTSIGVGTTAIFEQLAGVFYFEIENDGTNIKYRFSHDGRSFYDFYSDAKSARFTTNPDYLFFHTRASGGTAQGSVDWVRRIS